MRYSMWKYRNLFLIVLFIASMLTIVGTIQSKTIGNHIIYLPVIAKAPPQYWARSYNLTEKTVRFVSETDQGYLIGGYGSDGGSFILKIAVGGHVLWYDNYAPAWFNAGMGTEDDGAVLVGGYQDNPYIVKVQADGTIGWQKTYQADEASLYQIYQTADGGYLASGLIADKDAWILKLDAQGEVVWQQRYGNADPQRIISGSLIRETQMGDIFVMVNATLLKLEATGTLLWQQTIPMGVADIQELPNGDLLFAGQKRDSLFWAAAVMVMAPDGTIKWQKEWGYPARISDVTISHDGHIIAVGYGAGQGWLMKFDQDGQVLWQNTYAGESLNDDLDKLLVDDAGNIVSIGTSCSLQNGEGCPLWIWRLPVDGGVPGCQYVQYDEVTEVTFSILPTEITVDNYPTTAVAVSPAAVAPTTQTVHSSLWCPFGTGG